MKRIINLKIAIASIAAIVILSGCASQNKIRSSAVNRLVDTTRTNTFVVEYDYITGVYTKNNLSPKVNNPVVFKINNINRLAYNVIINCRDSILAKSELSNELSMKADPVSEKAEKLASPVFAIMDKPLLINGDFKNLSPQVINETMKKLNSYENNTDYLNTQIAELTKKKIDITLQRDKVQEKIYKFQLSAETSVQDTLALLANKKDTLIRQISTVNTALTTVNQELQQYHVNVDEIDQFQRRSDRLQQMFEALRSSYVTILRSRNMYNDMLVVVNDPLLTYDNYIEKYQSDFEQSAKTIRRIATELEIFEQAYSELINEYNTIKSDWGLSKYFQESGREKLFFKIDKLKERADGIKKETDGFEIGKMLTNVADAVRLLRNKSSYQIVSRPIQPIYDLVIFDVDIKKSVKEKNTFHNERKFSHKEFTKNGMRLDVSLGLSGSYFHKTPTYALGTDAAGNISIFEEQKHLFVPSFLGLFTASFRNARHVTTGISVGLGIDATDGKLQLNNFFAGPSLIWGKQERVSFTAGATLKNIQKLKSEYKVGDLVGNQTDINNFLTDQYKLGVFVAVTYNLTKDVKKQLQSVKK